MKRKDENTKRKRGKEEEERRDERSWKKRGKANEKQNGKMKWKLKPESKRGGRLERHFELEKEESVRKEALKKRMKT